MTAVVVTSHTTTDPESARTAVSKVYAPEQSPFLFAGNPARVECTITTLQAGDLLAGRVRQNLPLRITMPPFDDFMATTLLQGGLGWDIGDGQMRISGDLHGDNHVTVLIGGSRGEVAAAAWGGPGGLDHRRRRHAPSRHGSEPGPIARSTPSWMS